ncbi:MAG: elongation factor P [Planctomycetota bacterium]|jgi:elongation factor P
MPSATDIRKGSVLVLDGELYVCTDFQHSTPGNKRGNVQTKLRGLQSGANISRKFSSTERVEFAFLDKRPCEYLYKDGASFVFMDTESYEQYHLAADQVGDQMRYIVENTTVQVTFFEGTAVSVELPGSVELRVTHTDPGIKGDSVSNVFKPATLETGLEIKVPNHVNVGDVVRVSTQTGEFQGRATS